MDEAFVLDLVEELPTSLRDQVGNFMAFADEAAEAIYESLALDPSPAVLHNFVALAGIWRLWRMIDSPFQLAQSAIRLLETTSTREFQLGAALYSAQSPPVLVLSELRQGLENALADAGLRQLARQAGLREVATYAYSITDG